MSTQKTWQEKEKVRDENRALFRTLCRTLSADYFPNYIVEFGGDQDYSSFLLKKDLLGICKFYLRLDPWTEKVSIDSSFRYEQQYYSCEDEKGNKVAISIGFSVKKSPELIARDIENRFMPNFTRNYKQILSKIQRQLEVKQIHLQTLESVCKQIGMPGVARTYNKEISFDFYCREGETNVSHLINKIQCPHGDSVEFQFKRMNCDEAIKFFEYIKHFKP